MTPLFAAALLSAGAPPAGPGLLVPAARTGGPADLFLVSPDTGDARNLTRTDGAEELYPAYSPDGRRVAFVARDKDGSIEVFACDAADGGNRVAVSRPPEGGGRTGCFAPSWSPDGRRVAYARGTPDNHFELHVAAADGSKDEAVRPGGCCPAWSPDGSAIAFVRREPGKPFALMAVAPDGSGERVLVPDLGPVEFADPAWSPDGSVIVYPAATAHGWQLFLVPATGGTPRQLTHLPGMNVNPVWLAPDRLLFGHFTKPGAAGAYLTIKADGTRLDVHPLTKTDPAHPFARPAAFVPRAEPKPDNPIRQVAAAEAAKPAATLAPVAVVPPAVPGSVGAVGWSADGRRLALGLEAGAVVVAEFDPARGVRMAEAFRGHDGPVAAVGFSPDGGSVVSAGADKSVRTWDVTRSGSRSVETDHAAAVDSVAVSADGRLVATGDADGVLKLRDAATGKPSVEVKACGAKRAGVSGLAFGKDDKVVFAGCGRWDVPVLGGSVAAFDPATGKELWRSTGMTGGVFALAASPDGGKLAGACLDTFVRVWDAASGKELACWRGHADRVTGVSWSADGRWVATGGFDHTVRVWDAVSGSPVRTVAGHAGPVVRVAFSPDGTHLVSTGRAGAVVVWKVTAE
jgi:WD40 repeat protein